ncbi:MAG: DUF3570 domain-containing protein [Cellvibrionaceae bacterium]
MKQKNKKLLALTAAALTLPGMTPKSVQAQAVPEKYTASYRYTEYKEDDQPADKTREGDALTRYDISIHQFSLVAPVASDISLNVDIATESMSGASPWYVIEGADGKPIQVMSGATIDESRDDIAFAANFYRETSRIGIGVARSSENDYESKSANINSTIWLNGNNTTLDVGFGFSDDEITPTQSPSIDPNRTREEDKSSESLSAGISQVVNKTLLVGAGIGYAVYDGYLSDPYKFAFLEDSPLLRDNRPDEKKQLSLDLRLRKYFTNYAGALHADYRLYDNDWGVTSHTLSLGWYQNIETWQLSTRLRWYDQSAANFYRNFYTTERADGYYSSDYRLSAYSAIGFKLGVSKSFEFGTFSIAYENYDSGKGRDSDGDLNPGLVDFDFISIGFDYKF